MITIIIVRRSTSRAQTSAGLSSGIVESCRTWNNLAPPQKLRVVSCSIHQEMSSYFSRDISKRYKQSSRQTHRRTKFNKKNTTIAFWRRYWLCYNDNKDNNNDNYDDTNCVHGYDDTDDNNNDDETDNKISDNDNADDDDDNANNDNDNGKDNGDMQDGPSILQKKNRIIIIWSPMYVETGLGC